MTSDPLSLWLSLALVGLAVSLWPVDSATARRLAGLTPAPGLSTPGVHGPGPVVGRRARRAVRRPGFATLPAGLPTVMRHHGNARVEAGHGLRRTPHNVRWRPVLLAAAGGGATFALLGGGLGMVTGLLTAAGTGWLMVRAEQSGTRRGLVGRQQDLPAVLDLLVGCLRAGHPLGRSLGLVAAAVDGPLSPDLGLAAALYELGADAQTTWSEWQADPVLAPVARCMTRTGHSGAALSRALSQLAEDSRAQNDERAEVAARRVGVLVLAPLGLCFLPAFVCLGVIPIVLGIAATVLP